MRNFKFNFNPKVSVLCCVILAVFSGSAFANSPDLQIKSEKTAAIITVPFAPTLADDGTRDDEVLYGMTAEVNSKQDDGELRELKMSYGYTTLVESKNFQIVSHDIAENWRSSVTHQVIAPFADILPKAETESYPPIITLPRGSYIIVGEPDSDDKRWLNAELFDGKKGWVNRELVRKIRKWNEFDEDMTRKNLADDALSYLGTGYRWGGKTPVGVDCSGFTHMVYMLNGLDIYRNASPKEGFPIALKHVEGVKSDDIYTRENLAQLKAGDLIYWRGHVGLYLGDGKYIHSNGRNFKTVINSLLPDDPDYREDLAKPSAVCTWGTAFPDKPDELIIKDFYAIPFTSDDAKIGYRFYVRADGYAPTRILLYPEGKNGEFIEIKATRRMLYDIPGSEHKDVPVYFYSKPGEYRPAVRLINDTGYRPSNKTISSDLFEMKETIIVK